jgi:hypothetical protein
MRSASSSDCQHTGSTCAGPDLLHSRHDHEIVFMRPPALFDQRHSIIVGGDALDRGIHMNVLLGQISEDGLDVFLPTNRIRSSWLVSHLEWDVNEEAVEYSRSTFDGQPIRSTVDLHEMVVMEEPDEGFSREIEGAFVGGCRPAEGSSGGANKEFRLESPIRPKS